MVQCLVSSNKESYLWNKSKNIVTIPKYSNNFYALLSFFNFREEQHPGISESFLLLFRYTLLLLRLNDLHQFLAHPPSGSDDDDYCRLQEADLLL
ncbi:hypothetical protein DMENIID0001_140270 [Sergentomyia squamirostris]